MVVIRYEEVCMRGGMPGLYMDIGRNLAFEGELSALFLTGNWALSNYR
jgi:hypothetical protein